MSGDTFRTVRSVILANAIVLALAGSPLGCSTNREIVSESAGGADGGSAAGTSGVEQAGTANDTGSAGSDSSSSAGTSSGTMSGGSGGADAGVVSGVSCKTVADCAGTDRECVERVCNSGTCDLRYVKAGTPTTTQSAGDCKKTTCDGAGAFSADPDDTDLPDDGNPCTLDVCVNGVPSHAPAATTVLCGSASQFKCDGKGACAGCAAASDCGQTNACTSFKCTAGVCSTVFTAKGQGDPGSQHAGDCKKNVCDGSGNPTTIADDADVPNDSKACTKDVCTNGVPSNPPVSANTSCGGISVCDGSGNCTCNDPNACIGKCGSFSDGCGRPVNCPSNTCTGQQTCGGGGTPNVCGCTPHTPVCPAGQCAGTADDGCGNQVTCTFYSCGCICPEECINNQCYCPEYPCS